jgi:hypothetical protein
VIDQFDFVRLFLRYYKHLLITVLVFKQNKNNFVFCGHMHMYQPSSWRMVHGATGYRGEAGGGGGNAAAAIFTITIYVASASAM